MQTRNMRRTLLLGVVATASVVWAAHTHFDVPLEELAWLLLYCVLGVLLMAVLAGLSVALVILLRRIWRR